MADPCIFCSKPGGSGEHLWSAKIGPEIEAYHRSSSRRSYKAVRVLSPEATVEESGMPLYATKIRCVCHSCNNGWMNRLDELVRTKLIRLMRGQAASYTDIEAADLASWLAMKFFVRDEYKRTASIFSIFDKSNFYLTGKPPHGMWIGIARCGEPVWAGAFQRQDEMLPHPSRRERTVSWTMGLGGTVAIGEYPALPSRTDQLEDRVLRLWPGPAAFEWPAKPRLTSAKVREIAVRLNPFAASFGLGYRPEVAGGEPQGPMNRHQRRSAAKPRG